VAAIRHDKQITKTTTDRTTQLQIVDVTSKNVTSRQENNFLLPTTNVRVNLASV
jgi:hypothetical protein